MLVGIHHKYNFIEIMKDGEVHVHRYNPNLSVDAEDETWEKSLVCIVNPELRKECEKLPSIIEEEPRYLDQDMNVVTRQGEDYKEFTLRTFLIKQNIKE